MIYSLVGQSERVGYFNPTNGWANKRVVALLYAIILRLPS